MLSVSFSLEQLLSTLHDLTSFEESRSGILYSVS